MDKYEVAKTIGEEFNYPWIEEMNCFDGFPEVLKKEDGTDIEGCDWYMGEGLNDFGTFIDIEVYMKPEMLIAAQHWCAYMNADEEDEFGIWLQIDYDTSEESAEMRGDDIESEDYEPTNDHIQIFLKSQTHLRQLAEGIKAYNKEFPAKPNSNREEVLEAVRTNGTMLQYAADSLKADREVVLEAVKSWTPARAPIILNNNALQYAADSLKADREVVLEAVKKYRSALQYASEELQNDPELKKLAEDRTILW